MPETGRPSALAPRRMWLRGLLAGLMLLAGSLLTAADEPAADERLIIDRIEFHGLVTVPEQLLRSLMTSTEGQVYDPATFEADYNRIRQTGLFFQVKRRLQRDVVAGLPRAVLVIDNCEEFPLIEGIEFLRVDTEGRYGGSVTGDTRYARELTLSESKIWESILSRPVAPDLKLDGNRLRRLHIMDAIALKTREAWERDRAAGRLSRGLTPEDFRNLHLDQYLSFEAPKESSGPQESQGSGPTARPGLFQRAQTQPVTLTTGEAIHAVGRLNLNYAHPDAAKIKELYATEGYEDVQVTYRAVPVRYGPDGRPLLVHLIFEIHEGAKLYPAEVVFSGTNVIPDEALLGTIRSRPMPLIAPVFMEDRAGTVQQKILELDRHEVEVFIRRQGYMNATVGLPQIEVDRSLPPRRGLGLHADWYEARLTFPVSKAGEHDRHFTGRIEILGNAAVSTEELREVMQIRPTGPFSQELVEADTKSILDLYTSRGRLETRIDMEQRQVAADDPRVTAAIQRGMAVVISGEVTNLHDLTVRVREGAEVSIGQIFVVGNTETRDDVVYRELRLTPGMRYNSRLIEASERALQNTQLFSQVRITPQPTKTGDDLVRDLKVDVTEAHTTGSLVLGFGFSSVDQFFANLTFDQKNFDITDIPQSWRDFRLRPPFIRSLKGGGQNFNVQLQVGGRSSSANVTFTEPWFTGRPLDFSTNLAVTRTNQVNYDDERVRFALGLGKRYGDINIWSLAGRYTIEQIRITNIDASAPLGIREVGGANLISRFTTTLSFDSRDLRPFPTSGQFFEMSVETVGGALGGDFDFVKGIFRGTQYITLYEDDRELRHTLLFGMEMGRVAPYGRSDFVPVFDRFFAGSIGSVRGFQRRSISPRDQGDPVGGENILTFSVQYSFPLFAESDPELVLGTRRKRQRSYFQAYQREILRGILFFDGGTVTHPSSQPTTAAGFTTERDLRLSIGFGIMLRVPQLPVPLKIYYARPIRQASEDDVERVQLDLSAFFGR